MGWACTVCLSVYTVCFISIHMSCHHHHHPQEAVPMKHNTTLLPHPSHPPTMSGPPATIHLHVYRALDQKHQVYTHWATYEFPVHCTPPHTAEAVVVDGVHGSRWRLGAPRHPEGGTGACWTPLLDVGQHQARQTKHTTAPGSVGNSLGGAGDASDGLTRQCSKQDDDKAPHAENQGNSVRAFPVRGKVVVVLAPLHRPPLSHTRRDPHHQSTTIEASFELPTCETRQSLHECEPVVWLAAGNMEGPAGGMVLQLRLERAGLPRERVEGEWLVYQPTRGAIALAMDVQRG